MIFPLRLNTEYYKQFGLRYRGYERTSSDCEAYNRKDSRDTLRYGATFLSAVSSSNCIATTLAYALSQGGLLR